MTPKRKEKMIFLSMAIWFVKDYENLYLSMYLNGTSSIDVQVAGLLMYAYDKNIQQPLLTETNCIPVDAKSNAQLCYFNSRIDTKQTENRNHVR